MQEVLSADLDGDGDADVLASGWSDDTVVWFENLGAGALGPEQVIAVTANSAAMVHAADLNGDGDPDVLSASYSDDKIAWYKNTLERGCESPE